MGVPVICPSNFLPDFGVIHQNGLSSFLLGPEVSCLNGLLCFSHGTWTILPDDLLCSLPGIRAIFLKVLLCLSWGCEVVLQSSLLCCLPGSVAVHPFDLFSHLPGFKGILRSSPLSSLPGLVAILPVSHLSFLSGLKDVFQSSPFSSLPGSVAIHQNSLICFRSVPKVDSSASCLPELIHQPSAWSQGHIAGTTSPASCWIQRSTARVYILCLIQRSSS
uniref:uncharacterized protein LOC109960923 n=1 Tax=Monopterus albus TaxID=43700 RepID=UPI0009B3D210|nr:uncharacterized protein LOC109960923 [Monopterus albus]